MRTCLFALTLAFAPTAAIGQAPYVSTGPVRVATLYLPGTVNTDADE